MTRGTRSNHHPPRYYAIAAILLIAGAVIGLGLSAALDFPRSSIAQRAEGDMHAVLASTPASAAMIESPFVAVVDQALPAVVFIDVRKEVRASADDPDDLLRRFFGDGRSQRPRSRPSSGSGFIIDAKGYILTNNHVVREADDIKVTLNDNRTFKAKLVGADPETDVAVIKIEGKDLPVLPLGDSDNLRVGDWAIAIGNPLGELKGSVTVGIVSARGRSNLNIWGGTPEYQDFIQTDASINFGNSGGPLCNIRGEAIGVNTAINPSGQGIGFAIPINLARHVSEQLIAHGSVQRAMLGVFLAPLTPELAEGFGIPGQEGVLIQRVMDDSPAKRAGLQRNDVIVSFDGKDVTDLQKFRLRVAETRIGSRVPVEVLRNGKPMQLTVTLAERDSEMLAEARPGQSTPEADEETVAGLFVRTMSSGEMRTAGVRSGVMIVSIEQGSEAEDAGLEPGDIIEEVGGKQVKSVEEFTAQVEAAKERSRHAVLLVNRSGNTQFIALRVRP